MVILFVALTACGKVAEDINTQSQQSIFKELVMTVPLNNFGDSSFKAIVSTNNQTLHYSYLAGISYDKGQDKVGWVEANTKVDLVGSNNVLETTNYDAKKNTVKSSRYQQGLINTTKVSTDNYQVRVDYKKIRPKYDLFAFYYYLDKNDVLFYVLQDLPTKNVTVTRYDHLVSAIFLQHIQEESYNEDTIIPFSDFKQIIPTAAVTPTLNIYATNSSRYFKVDQPIFQTESTLYDALLALVKLTFYSEQIDATDYIDTQTKETFSDQMKTQLTTSVEAYFLNKNSISTSSIEEL